MTFTDGRYLFSWLRDHGASVVAIQVSPVGADRCLGLLDTGLRRTIVAKPERIVARLSLEIRHRHIAYQMRRDTVGPETRLPLGKVAKYADGPADGAEIDTVHDSGNIGLIDVG